MEMTSKRKDRVGLKRYGLTGDDMYVLRDVRVVGANTPLKGNGKLTARVGSYIFTSNDDGETWTGPHFGKPDLDAILKKYYIKPVKVDPIVN